MYYSCNNIFRTVVSFFFFFLITFSISCILFFTSRRGRINHEIRKKDAYLIVTSSWFLISIFGAFPYILSGSIPSINDAFFESVSGFSTTGASILTDIEVLPKSILFWRSLTHWIGGIGIIVLVIIIMPMFKIGGNQLFILESSLQEKIVPKTKSVGKRLLLIYLILSFAQVVFLLFGGMNLFESLCHTFGTVATGGFSPKNTSVAEYSPYIQYVIMIFMLLAGVNFVVHYYMLNFKLEKVIENEEFRFYLFVVAIIGIIVTIILYTKTDRSFEQSFRDAFFQVISIITCTGFVSSDYLLWPTSGMIIIYICLFLGGSTGSTAGGIKMARHLIFLKNVKLKIKTLINSRAVFQITLNKKRLPASTNFSVITFITLYFLTFLTGSIFLVIMGSDAGTSTSAVATCMGGVGPGIGAVGPVSNFSAIPEPSKLILSFVMIIGRLELYTALMLFSKEFWL